MGWCSHITSCIAVNLAAWHNSKVSVGELVQNKKVEYGLEKARICQDLHGKQCNGSTKISQN